MRCRCAADQRWLRPWTISHTTSFSASGERTCFSRTATHAECGRRTGTAHAYPGDTIACRIPDEVEPLAPRADRPHGHDRLGTAWGAVHRRKSRARRLLPHAVRPFGAAQHDHHDLDL